MNTATKIPTAYCMKCTTEDLPTSHLCDRSERFDNGADADTQFEGTCLRCCEHNHG